MSTLLPAINALGTVWWIEVFAEISEARTQAVVDGLRSIIYDFENHYSRFKTTSLISQINNTGKLNNPDAMTVDILKRGQALYSKTGGLFNLLIGEILESRGYGKDYSFKPKEIIFTDPDPLTDLDISSEAITLKSGKIDLGGFGKGYLIDLLAQELQNTYDLNYFLINGGGDMYATSDNGESITIYLEHPIQANEYIGTTTILNQGFAASSPHKRRWVVNNKKYHHIVGKDKDAELEIDGVFTKSDNACDADASATTALLLNTEAISDFAKNNNLQIAYMKANESALYRVGGFVA